MEQTHHFRMGKQLLDTGHRIRRHLDGLFEEDRLTGLQGRIVGFVFLRGQQGQDVYQKDLEEEFGIGRSSVTSVLNNLEKNGFITRQLSENDRRLKKITLTEKALHTAEAHRRRLDAFERQLSETLSSEELAVMKDLLERITRALGDPKEDQQ